MNKLDTLVLKVLRETFKNHFVKMLNEDFPQTQYGQPYTGAQQQVSVTQMPNLMSLPGQTFSPAAQTLRGNSKPAAPSIKPKDIFKTIPTIPIVNTLQILGLLELPDSEEQPQDNSEQATGTG